MLENRQLLSAVWASERAASVGEVHNMVQTTAEAPPIVGQNGDEIATSGPRPSEPPEVPALNSNPEGKATLFLDFDGNYETRWCTDLLSCETNIWTPVFDFNPPGSGTQDQSSFNAHELAAIEEIWQRVAEDFSPFNINVTTVDPGSFTNKEALKVAIGGSSQMWYGEPNPGVAGRNSFTNPYRNTVFVFSNNLLDANGVPDANGDGVVDNDFAKNVADIATHEAGHAFGLWHQAEFDDDGDLVLRDTDGDGVPDSPSDYRDYMQANPSFNTAPLMGRHYSGTRTLWDRGTAHKDAAKTNDKWQHFLKTLRRRHKIGQQDDIAVIARDRNGFGRHSDSDGGDTVNTAEPLQQAGGAFVQRRGVIERMGDVDFYSFNVDRPSRVEFTAEVLDADAYMSMISTTTPWDGANLDARIAVFSASGDQITTWNDPAPNRATGALNLNTDVSATLDPGKYFVAVGSHGNYGDVGQYWLSGTITEIPPIRLENGILHINGTVGNDSAEVAYRPGTSASRFNFHQSLSSNPGFLADLPTDDDRDRATLRVQNLHRASVAPLAAQGTALHLTGNDGMKIALANVQVDEPIVTVSLAQHNDFGNPVRRWQESFDPDVIQQIVFHGYDGDDRFTNQTSIGSTAHGGKGHDSLHGGAAVDRLFGGDDVDWLYGHDGDDTIEGGFGNDHLFGHQGNDRLEGDGFSFDSLLGGNDTIDGGPGDDTLFGGGGADTLLGRLGQDRLDGGRHNDRLNGGSDDDRLWGRHGDDTLDGSDGNDLLRGGSGRDLLKGRRGNDTIHGHAGRDTLQGGSGNDRMHGGPDDDSLVGGYGQDTMRGGRGHDTLRGNQGNDWMHGHRGRDWMHGGSGEDSLYGGHDDDTLYGGYGDDFLRGDDGNDRIDGQYGADTVEGSAGNDALYGHKGDDRLLGGPGRDALDGYHGRDYLDGGYDDQEDVLKGGGHVDTFVQHYNVQRKPIGVDRFGNVIFATTEVAEDVLLDYDAEDDRRGRS